jgi:cation diffusion facilitator CzcD-associated flavoprotein CzcO
MSSCDVAIVGAGPYGLSAAAYLGAVKGLDTRVFGRPMSFWTDHMPAGMLLRSPYAGTHLADPSGALTLDHYQVACRTPVLAPVPLEVFVGYGCWFQQQAVPHVDPRAAIRIAADSRGFRLTLDDGELCSARRVIVAAGIAPFAVRPLAFRDVPASMVSHTSDHQEMSGFAGKQVLVVGGGQSALESAALIREAGGEVEVAIRAPAVRWLHRRAWMHRHLIGRALYAPPDVGPAGVSHVVARPNMFHRLPRGLQDYLGPLSIRPGGAAWLRPRCEKIAIHLGCSVTALAAAGDRVRVVLSDGIDRTVDHVLLGTGYRVDISRYSFLAPPLLESIRRTDGHPELDLGLECSVPGLHFVGAPAAWSFGPLMRFVAGCGFAARAVVRRIDRSRQRASARMKPTPRAAALKTPHRAR